MASRVCSDADLASLRHSTETTDPQPPLLTDEGKAEAPDQSDKEVAVVERDGCVRRKSHKHRSHRRVRSLSLDEGLAPRPSAKGKKKKRKSERKRKRKRSPSYSLSPPRKKKKKRKKSSKKSKRHRSSSVRHKRKDERKHKKSSRSRPHRRHRRRRSESDRSSWRSSPESRYPLQAVEEHDSGREESRTELNQRDLDWRPAVKSVCKTAPQYVSTLSAGTILPLKFGDKLLHGNGNHGPHDYDSGNDTSSPPSSKNSISQPSGIADSSNHCRDLASPDKLKFTERDNASDSGNSVTSYASLCKPLTENSLSSTFFNGKSKELSVEGEEVRPQKRRRSTLKTRRSSRRRRRERSVSRSPSRSSSCGSSRHSGHSSRGRSLSSCSSYSRSPSYSAARKRGGDVASTSSRDSYSRYSPDRSRDRKRSSSYKEKDPNYRHKEGRRKSRRKSYSPMRKRRRDSPSHLEARRITSARKRPIPYFRPSPSSSCRSTSVSSWSSIFTRSRSCSRTSGHSYRSNSRSSSWNSIFGTRESRSRSPSYVRLKKSSKTRR
ncbi:Serine/arginine repetitive matrix protein 4 [Merluccius polli]|uniref:Serine/arginine repetitive matrix protein 4 n=1 Tax=Merluccius polli TaxID=89951 RepID=A0AA47MKW9_MERPO|nr:Serine/arginine repetitive matrix protein 4 [Merluccius polli]